ncbi:MAG: CocE/NonD family hydrolase [Chloroflexota bacterium]|nr:CocE/NonD family hydrolase [Chloroflexota bacterium]
MSFWSADLRRAIERAGELVERALVTPFKDVPTDIPHRYTDVDVDYDVAVPMRDGVVLKADVYRPAGQEQRQFPVVLIRMPYGKQEAYCYMPAHGKYWARKGYICVVQDVRGRFAAGGAFDPFVNEADDGWDTLNWVAAQRWCDGNIGMTGESYYGYTQWAVAPRNHPNLKCIVPGNTAANIYGVWFYVNGAFCLQTMGQWSIYMNHRVYANSHRLTDSILKHLPLNTLDDAAGVPSPFYKAVLAHPTRDAFWERINIDRLYHQINIPVLSWGGWYDTFLKGTLEDWWGMASHPDPKVARHQYLLIAPTDHEMTPWRTGRVGGQSVGGEAWSYDWIARFFERYLQGVDNGIEEGGRVRLFVMGANRWHHGDAFPLPETQYTRWYLHSGGHANTAAGDGALRLDAPTTDEPADMFIYDPDDPVTLTAQTDLWYLAEELKDRALIDERQDVLHYTSAPLTQPLTLMGAITLHLCASSSARDTDFSAALVDVSPDGRGHLIQEGIVRARWRDGNTPALLTPGEVYPFTIDLWATGYEVAAGQRLRLEISSSNFDRYDRHPNTDAPFAQSAERQTAEQRIYHTPTQPSYVVLPLVGKV